MIELKGIVRFVQGDVIADVSSICINSALAITDANFNNKCIGWCSDSNIGLLNNLNQGNVLVSKEVFNQIDNTAITLVAVENPRRSFAKILKEFFAKKITFGSVADSANIHRTVQFEKSKVLIGENVVIEEDVQLGENVSIGHNTVVKSGTIIHDNVAIGSNCTIGGVGFGYEKSPEGDYILMPHIGNVVLSESVEIGNNVCIDRAVMGSTFLGVNVKVDNLVHIAHGVQVGKNSLVIANAMIAGSVEIGENVWIAPSTSIRQKLKINDNSLVGLGSVVVKNVEESSVVAGVPAKPLSKS